MKLLICGSEEITPEYMFITDDEENYFEDILDELINEIEAIAGNDVKLLTRGLNAGIDAMVNLYCADTGIELEEKRPVKKLIEKDGELLRDIQLINECDAGLIFCIKYQKFKDTDLDKISSMLEDRGKPIYIFPMEKYS